MLLRCALAVSLPVRKLFFDRFALPTSRHTLMLLPIPVRSVRYSAALRVAAILS